MEAEEEQIFAQSIDFKYVEFLKVVYIIKNIQFAERTQL